MNSGIYVAGVGASAGGVKALREFFSHVRPDSNAAFVVVTHLPPHPRTMLHTILSRVTAMNVELVEGHTALMPNHIYVIPGHVQVRILHDVLLVRERDPRVRLNRAINEFFISLAKEKGALGIAVVLSGMGKDGADGTKAVHENHGFVLVQEPSSADFSSMPIESIKADHPQEILKPAKLAEAFNHYVETKKVGATV